MYMPELASKHNTQHMLPAISESAASARPASHERVIRDALLIGKDLGRENCAVRLMRKLIMPPIYIALDE